MPAPITLSTNSAVRVIAAVFLRIYPVLLQFLQPAVEKDYAVSLCFHSEKNHSSFCLSLLNFLSLSSTASFQPAGPLLSVSTRPALSVTSGGSCTGDLTTTG